jgi:predicted PurR-regulated permease PerM
MKRIAWYTALILTTLTFLVLLWQFRLAIVLFGLSLATAAAFRPAIARLVERGFRRGPALFLVYLLTLAVIAGVLFLLVGPLIRDLQHAIDDLVAGYETIINRWPEAESAFQRAVAARLPPIEELYANLTGEQGQAVLQSIIGFASNIFNLASNLVIILILSMYWSADSVHFERLWLSLVSVERRAHLRAVWRSTEAGVGSYIRSRIIQSLVAGALLWFGYWTMGIEYPALLAVIGAFTRLIPWLGSILALFPPLIVGFTISPGVGVLAAIYTLMVLAVMELVISPRFFSIQDYSSLLIVLVTIALAQGLGLLGLIFGPPLAVAIQIIFEMSVQPPMASPSSEVMRAEARASPPAQELQQLRDRLTSLQEHLNDQDGAAAPEMVSMVKRLDGLLEKTNNYLSFGQKAR